MRNIDISISFLSFSLIFDAKAVDYAIISIISMMPAFISSDYIFFRFSAGFLFISIDFDWLAISAAIFIFPYFLFSSM